MEFSARQQWREQHFIRAVTDGNLINRDYLINYSVGEFYQEMSLFIEETEQKVAALKNKK
jgi:hypothetical protein